MSQSVRVRGSLWEDASVSDIVDGVGKFQDCRISGLMDVLGMDASKRWAAPRRATNVYVGSAATLTSGTTRQWESVAERELKTYGEVSSSYP